MLWLGGQLIFSRSSTMSPVSACFLFTFQRLFQFLLPVSYLPVRDFQNKSWFPNRSYALFYCAWVHTTPVTVQNGQTWTQKVQLCPRIGLRRLGVCWCYTFMPWQTTHLSPCPHLSRVPAEYHDFCEVFSKAKATLIPLHRPYDCSIVSVAWYITSKGSSAPSVWSWTGGHRDLHKRFLNCWNHPPFVLSCRRRYPSSWQKVQDPAPLHRLPWT